MAGSSPARRSLQVTSPERNTYGTYLSNERNNLKNHDEALAASKDEHDRVRDYALRALEKHVYQLEQLRIQDEESQILEKQKREKERLEREKKLREEEKRLRELEAQQIPKLPPKPSVEAAPAPAPAAARTEPTGSNGAAGAPLGAASSKGLDAVAPSTQRTNGTNVANTTQPTAPPAQEASPLVAKQSESAAKPNPFASSGTPAATPASNPFAAGNKPAASPFGRPPGAPAVNGFNTPTPGVPSSTIGRVAVPTPAAQTPDRYVQIHQTLKKLRASIKQQMTTNIDLKKNAGNYRREIRKSIGQLTGERGSNKQQLEKIRLVLTAALQGQIGSALVDPSEFVRDKREPAPDAAQNGQLPSLFIYLLNCMAKDMIKQFDSECGPMPDKADPIGVTAAQIFSTKDFMWRGISLIDIMIAKFRIACPVLFGVRGNEKTEQGRLRLGWRKPEGHWMPDQQHYERMSGLGVGYASIALRDFSKAKATNPYPPANYWTAFAKIVNTPPAEISDTQCVVLRAMIHLSEDRFISFYGNQAIAALRKALVELPSKVPNKTSAVSGLAVLANLYQKDIGLDLR
ncbi:GLE1-like protein-domain-containing protein [Truncatella angustata]|uniref:mRNA export factor GLE1 n=1 Tax=Truncatella angustata TaxID=152316 RepID=A0A9P8UMU9_9PEZI|nr:GLE1-like protein-domain-containing protein [Truncatella angustata]KAH6655113.1 GLE1-like protein-domain-containing protein [Truncatella angustata]KAH8198216.1 hypothetical protein TruAng_007600 [Truncatella angustata]